MLSLSLYFSFPFTHSFSLSPDFFSSFSLSLSFPPIFSSSLSLSLFLASSLLSYPFPSSFSASPPVLSSQQQDNEESIGPPLQLHFLPLAHPHLQSLPAVPIQPIPQSVGSQSGDFYLHLSPRLWGGGGGLTKGCLVSFPSAHTLLGAHASQCPAPCFLPSWLQLTLGKVKIQRQRVDTETHSKSEEKL